MAGLPLVLIIDDNPADVYLLTEALREFDVAARLLVLAEGESAIHYVQHPGEVPAVILLDLNLPKKSGLQVLQVIRSTQTYRNLPVIVFSSSPSESERSLISALGVTAYVSKSLDLDEFNHVGSVVKQVLIAQAAQPPVG